MEAKAILRHCPMSARKVRLVADIIRGKEVTDALYTLKFTRKKAASILEKVLLSAVANWEYKNDNTVDADDYKLVIKKLLVDQATPLKRFRPAPMGRAMPYKKHRCHITIVIENKVPLPTEQEQSEQETETVSEETAEKTDEQ